MAFLAHATGLVFFAAMLCVALCGLWQCVPHGSGAATGPSRA